MKALSYKLDRLSGLMFKMPFYNKLSSLQMKQVELSVYLAHPSGLLIL